MRENQEIKLTVAEAPQIDVGRGIVRLPGDIMDRLGIEAGDVIEIKGKHKAIATAWRSKPED
ncbi:MAG: hypothetical protein GXP45_07000, partial [bacterium]|nr:hypothetical protein [bacterium]